MVSPFTIELAIVTTNPPRPMVSNRLVDLRRGADGRGAMACIAVIIITTYAYVGPTCKLLQLLQPRLVALRRLPQSIRTEEGRTASWANQQTGVDVWY